MRQYPWTLIHQNQGDKLDYLALFNTPFVRGTPKGLSNSKQEPSETQEIVSLSK